MAPQPPPRTPAGAIRITRTGHTAAAELATGETLVLTPILAIGRNYADHAKEQNKPLPDRPMVFCKNPASACLSGDAITLPRACADRDQVDYEGELAVIIGRAARDVQERDALDHVLGYTCANDVSARWWQDSGAGGQFFRGKSFDTFCPLGPHITPATLVPDPQSLVLTARLSGETVQHAPTSAMVFSVAFLIAELSRDMTLAPGTVILTGTPGGVGKARTPPRFLREGDTVEVEITGPGGLTLGTLRNPVRGAR